MEYRPCSTSVRSGQVVVGRVSPQIRAEDFGPLFDQAKAEVTIGPEDV
jgi:hypothetical protein